MAEELSQSDRLCACGCKGRAHARYSEASWCSLCGPERCPAFLPAWLWWLRRECRRERRQARQAAQVVREAEKAVRRPGMAERGNR